MKQHKLEIDLLKRQIEELTIKNKILNDAVQFYAEPLCKFDKGEKARSALKMNSNNYKPANGEFAYIAKAKKMFPFVVFDHVGEEDEE